MTDTQDPSEILDAQKWAHEFDVRYIRPAAAEFDERESTPWLVIAEAAAAGLHSADFALQMRDDPTGLLMPVVCEEIYWGDDGMGQALLGTYLPVFALFGAATQEQIDHWLRRSSARQASPLSRRCVRANPVRAVTLPPSRPRRATTRPATNGFSTV